jgi:D-glycero-alpha-D-manno-heptose-7-phosphate kinase
MHTEKRVVMTRTPFRISFAGGGTDIPDYYRNYGVGAVVSATMNRYVYIIVNDDFYGGSYRAHYSKVEDYTPSIEGIRHPSIRECIRLVGVDKGIEVTTVADMPARGTGIGSSSSFAVGLLNALHIWKGEVAIPEQLAKEAIKVEREVLNEPGGRQDQYVAAMGGLMLMEFNKDESVNIKRVKMENAKMQEFNRHLLLLFTGKERHSGEIHMKQMARVSACFGTYKKMADLAHRQFAALEDGRWEETGRILHENWMLKKTLVTGISDPYIDTLYDTALRNGAEGGKIMGAGGGGFLLLFAPPEKHEQILGALPDLKQEKVSLELSGSTAIYSQGLNP